MEIKNPITNKLIKVIEEDTLESVMTKLTRAKAASLNYKKSSLDDRLSIISIFKSLLHQDIDQLAADLTNEMGKPLAESKSEINSSIAKIDYFLNHAEQVLAPRSVFKNEEIEEVIEHEPLGVICNISAWNYPYLVGFNIFIPALIAGNAVLYKPSEFASLSGENLTKLLHKAGIPEDIFIPVYGDGVVGNYLLNLPLDGYFFTGSHKTGQHIAKTVASGLVPVGLELGGKDPVYITEEIDDLEKTVDSIVSGVFYNNGQSCCSIERVYIHQDIYEQFTSLFIEKVKCLKVGDPLDEKNHQGAIARAGHLVFLLGQIKDAISKGASLETGGKQLNNGPFLGPTVLTNVDHSMSVMKDESFGPLIGLMKVSGDDEAISLMNHSDYGLTSSVYTHNFKRGKEILKNIDSGTGYLNCCDRVSPYLPWSGRKNSGLGSTLSEIGLSSFCSLKSYHLKK